MSIYTTQMLDTWADDVGDPWVPGAEYPPSLDPIQNIERQSGMINNLADLDISSPQGEGECTLTAIYDPAAVPESENDLSTQEAIRVDLIIRFNSQGQRIDQKELKPIIKRGTREEIGLPPILESYAVVRKRDEQVSEIIGSLCENNTFSEIVYEHLGNEVDDHLREELQIEDEVESEKMRESLLNRASSLFWRALTQLQLEADKGQCIEDNDFDPEIEDPPETKRKESAGLER